MCVFIKWSRSTGGFLLVVALIYLRRVCCGLTEEGARGGLALLERRGSRVPIITVGSPGVEPGGKQQLDELCTVCGCIATEVQRQNTQKCTKGGEPLFCLLLLYV